jgi:hypothetical protein
MAVNGHEKAQIGHYHLLKREYAAALARYQEAEREMPLPRRPTLEEFARNLQSPRDIALFEYHCLKKLGRDDEANAKLDLFLRTFLPELTADERIRGLEWLRERGELWLFLVREFYAAEVFLSLDAAEDARPYFEAILKSAKTDAERLGAALALGQILLLTDKHQEYAELTTATVIPLLVKMTKAEPAEGKGADLLGDANTELLLLATLALAPLESPEFLIGLPEDQLAAWLPRWTTLREQAAHDATRFELDLMLYAGNDRLGREGERAAIWQRIDKNPLRGERLPKEGYGDPTLELRRGFKEMSQSNILRP